MEPKHAGREGIFVDVVPTYDLPKRLGGAEEQLVRSHPQDGRVVLLVQPTTGFRQSAAGDPVEEPER